MNIVRFDKVVLVKELENLKSTGKEYEVANITNISVIVRDAKTKVAICSVDIDKFDQYFKKVEDAKGWTNWQRLMGANNDTMASYRTNYKKVQVRLIDGTKSEATCHVEDKFNLMFGIRLAYLRCCNKLLKRNIDTLQETIKTNQSGIDVNNDIIQKMLKSLCKDDE